MRLVYLMRNNEKAEVTLVFKKPVGVRVAKNLTAWYYRNFDFRLGQMDNRLLYADGWTGPIGVFDTDQPGHLKNMFDAGQTHLRSMLTHKATLICGEG